MYVTIVLYRLINSARDYFTPYMYVTTLGFTNDKKEIERMVANAMLHNYLPVVFTVIKKGIQFIGLTLVINCLIFRIATRGGDCS